MRVRYLRWIIKFTLNYINKAQSIEAQRIIQMVRIQVPLVTHFVFHLGKIIKAE